MTKQIYDKGQVEIWSIEYKRCFSFNKVAKMFGVDRGTVRSRLLARKNELGILLRSELLSTGLKFCISCNIVKNIENFGKNRYAKNGSNYICKSCSNKRYEDYRKNNIDKVKNNVKKSTNK